MENTDHESFKVLYENGIMSIYFPDHTQEEAEEYAEKIQNLIKEYLDIDVEVDY